VTTSMRLLAIAFCLLASACVDQQVLPESALRTAQPPEPPAPQPSTPKASAPAAIDVSVVVPADAISLRPRVESADERGFRPGNAPVGDSGQSFVVILPLPPLREHLRRVDTWLSVTRKEDGRVFHQQHVVFGRYTTGDSLRFYLPALPGGSYQAELRTIAQIEFRGSDGQLVVREEADSASIEVKSTSAPAAPPATVHSFSFHFRRGQADLVDDDARALDDMVKHVRFVLVQNQVTRAQIDCWASKEGERDLNLRLSQRRCAWFRSAIWDARLKRDTKPALSTEAHGPDNPPVDEPEVDDVAILEQARGKNRVVVLRLFAGDEKISQ
jgi:outer membrane protein OmpA-like peptidoglycan-associated protein